MTNNIVDKQVYCKVKEGFNIFPERVRIFIDGIDRTEWIFGDDTITPSLAKHSWTNIDITQFVKARGTHIIEITCEAGVGRVEVVTEIE